MAEQDFATDAEMRKKLRDPFPPELISKLPATNKRPALDYVGHAAVTDRLNTAAPGWTMSEPQFIVAIIDGQEHVMGVVCSMTIGTVTRWEVGDVDRPSEYGDEAKKALSNWIRRAGMRFGIALDLWAKEDLHSGVEQTLDGPAPDGAAVVDGDVSREAPSPPAAVAPPPVGEPTDPSVGQAAQDAASPSNEYLNDKEAKALRDAFGGQAKLMNVARARYGEHIRRAVDLTRDQARQLLESK